MHFLKLIEFTVLFYFVSSDQSEMIGWLKSKSLTRYHVHPRLISKPSYKKCNTKVQHVSAQQRCCTFLLHF